MSKHTQGEWTVLDNRENAYEPGAVHVIADGGLTIATIVPQQVSADGQVERMANALLIAAAPELLEALAELLAAEEAVFPAFEEGQDAQDAWATRKTAARYVASEILRKATGEQS